MKAYCFLSLLSLSGLAVARTLNIVAHQNDDILFQNPDILNDIAAGPACPHCAMQAYAAMAGMPNVWDESDIGVEGKDIPVYSLRDRDISLTFMHMPDGSIDGDGFASTGHESLEKLWKGKIDSIRTVDESGTSYTRSDLIETLAQIINDFHPDCINSQDYVHPYGSGDHSDHTSAGLFANEGAKESKFQGNVMAYRGYPTKDEPANVAGSDLDRKKAAFYTYGNYDPVACSSDQSCAGTDYEKWLLRQYIANNEVQRPKFKNSTHVPLPSVHKASYRLRL
ncbi:hypothetical protein IFM58399_05604 [Aspergillus lentulus]|uniref:uncharacterized protein n=1 Tax=Aspergillus lentulus TaxID=293939 RepID=UPI00139473BD|nr:uncharacterized protein IFM58399_05604 [Aspergillus lentulus]KAF4160054.1 hypothetical protein CNMCM6069_009738 [Aspergillus lentulus]KAF4168840.1 hypothetical protein CNMCM6936_000785 [Aspergillus lentulus]GFF39506.1 hypothetical protein IFM58399_05604 [Aspergillus lentulus]